jgi:hypothetical protein
VVDGGKPALPCVYSVCMAGAVDDACAALRSAAWEGANPFAACSSVAESTVKMVERMVSG